MIRIVSSAASALGYFRLDNPSLCVQFARIYSMFVYPAVDNPSLNVPVSRIGHISCWRRSSLASPLGRLFVACYLCLACPLIFASAPAFSCLQSGLGNLGFLRIVCRFSSRKFCRNDRGTSSHLLSARCYCCYCNSHICREFGDCRAFLADLIVSSVSLDSPLMLRLVDMLNNLSYLLDMLILFDLLRLCIQEVERPGYFF